MTRPGCTQLCSNHGCLNTAVDLAPRHLCGTCKEDPKLNGPEPVWVERPMSSKKEK